MNSTVKHKTGPLEAHTDGKTWWVQTPAPYREIVATNLTKANAHLIAAAPDMYEALKHVADGRGDHSQLLDAIAKAEGRS